MTVDPLIQSLKGKLVVSVQAYMGEPIVRLQFKPG